MGQGAEDLDQRWAWGGRLPPTEPRPTVAPQQCGAEEKLRMVRDVVTTWNDCAWVTDRDALIAILSIVGDKNQP